MKIKSRIMDKSGMVQYVEVKHDLGIKIEHNNRLYTLSEDNQGCLLLRAMDGEIYVRPKSGNSIEILGRWGK